MKITQTPTYVKCEVSAPSGTTCVVMDMDDTLARYCKTRRLPACDEFEPMPLLARALEYQDQGHDLIIATARPCWCLDKTLVWLQRHGLRAQALYLRRRTLQNGYPAHELKRSMLEDIRDLHEVVCFYDDSPWNCAVARELQIPTFFVKGNEEYWLSKGARENWDLDIAEFCPISAIR